MSVIVSREDGWTTTMEEEETGSREVGGGEGDEGGRI